MQRKFLPLSCLLGLQLWFLFFTQWCSGDHKGYWELNSARQMSFLLYYCSSPVVLDLLTNISNAVSELFILLTSAPQIFWRLSVGRMFLLRVKVVDDKDSISGNQNVPFLPTSEKREVVYPAYRHSRLYQSKISEFYNNGLFFSVGHFNQGSKYWILLPVGLPGLL